MFDDPKRELKRLEEQLLKEDDTEWLDRELAQAYDLLGEDVDMDATQVFREPIPVRNYANGYDNAPDIYNYADNYVDTADTAPVENLNRRIGGLLLLAAAETLGIATILAYWVVQIL